MNTQESSREVSVAIPARIKMMQDAKLDSISLSQMIDPLTQSEILRIEERLIQFEKTIARANRFFDEFQGYKEVVQNLAVELGLMHKTGFFNCRINKDQATIVAAVASAFGLSVKQIMSRRRPQEIAIPRMVAMYLMRNILGMTLQSIGTFFKKDHGTAIHAINQIRKFLSLRENGAKVMGLSQHIFRNKIKSIEDQFLTKEI